MATRRIIGSLQPDVDKIMALSELDFSQASAQVRADFIPDRKSVSFWHDAWRRLRKNTVAMVALWIIIALILFAFVGPMIVPYTYNGQVRGSENLHPVHYTLADQKLLADEFEKRAGALLMTPDEAVAKAEETAKKEGKTLSAIEKAQIRAKAKAAAEAEGADGVVKEDELRKELGIKAKLFGYSNAELARKEAGEKVFPHVLGTDKLGRDLLVRTMIGARVSMIVGIAAALLVLIIGAIYGSISGYCGGKVDAIMQRIVELIYSIPEVLVILLISATLGAVISDFQNSGDGFFQRLSVLLGANLIGMFMAFGMLFWVTMSRIIRGQILQLKNQEFVTAARALGSSGGKIIRKHLLPNCIGQIVVTTCLQIPSAIFLESFLSFLGVGVSAPLTSLGSMAAEALGGIYTYPYRLLFPAFVLSIMILSFNLFGDGLRDALDPRLKK